MTVQRPIDHYVPVPSAEDLKTGHIVVYGKKQKRRAVQISNGAHRRLPAMPYEIWLDPGGNACHLVVRCTRDESAPEQERKKYHEYMHATAIRENWIPVEYPDAQRCVPRMPPSSDAYKAFIACDGSDEKWAEFIKAEKQRRQAESVKRYEAIKAKTPDAIAKLANKQAFSEVMGEILEAIKGNAPAPAPDAPAAPDTKSKPGKVEK
jgi:hypothetical protein